MYGLNLAIRGDILRYGVMGCTEGVVIGHELYSWGTDKELAVESGTFWTWDVEIGYRLGMGCTYGVLTRHGM